MHDGDHLPAAPVPGRAYTPKQVADAGWLGDMTEGAIKKGYQRGTVKARKRGPKSEIVLTAEDIQATLDGWTSRDRHAAPTTRRSRRRLAASSLSSNVQQLQPRPERARKQRTA